MPDGTDRVYVFAGDPIAAVDEILVDGVPTALAGGGFSVCCERCGAWLETAFPSQEFADSPAAAQGLLALLDAHDAACRA